MRFYSLVLAYVMFCGLVSAASCTKEVSPGLEALAYPGFILWHPNTYITIKSSGHTIEVVFVAGGGVEMLVDGQRANPDLPGDNTFFPYNSSAEALVATLCPGFLPGPVSGFSRNFTASTVATPGTVSGHTSEDVVIADFNGDGAPDNASLTGNGISVALRETPIQHCLSRHRCQRGAEHYHCGFQWRRGAGSRGHYRARPDRLAKIAR